MAVSAKRLLPTRKQNGAKVKRAAEKTEAERHHLKQEIDQTAVRPAAPTAPAKARRAKRAADRADGKAMLAKLADDKAPVRDALVDKAEPAPEPPGWRFSALALPGYAAFAVMWRNGWPPKWPNANAASGVDAAKAAAVEREGAKAADRTHTYAHLATRWPWKLRGTPLPFVAALKEISRNQAADTLFWAFGAVASLWFILCIIFRIGGDTRAEYFVIGLAGAALLWGSGWLMRAFLLGRRKFESSDLSYSPAATARPSEGYEKPPTEGHEKSPTKRRVKQTTKRSTAVSTAKRRRQRASPQGQVAAPAKPANRARKIPAKP